LEDIAVRVLHVVSTGGRRGAETFAADLVAASRDDELQQRVVILRGGKRREVPFQAPVAILRENGAGETLHLGVVRALRRLIRSWTPDVVLAHGGEPLKYSYLADRRGRRSLVYRRIGSVHPRTTFGARKAFYGAMMRGSARVVALADAIRAETVDTFGVAQERILTIPNGVDIERIRPRRAPYQTRRLLDAPERARVVASVGALTWEKDPLAQLDVAARVLEAIDEPAVFLLIGDGPLRDRAAEAVKRRRLERNVLVLGQRSDVPDLLVASDLLLVTSRTEGMPAAVIEAGMLGVPAVAYHVGGMAEVLRDGSTGLLVPPGDAEALASGIVGLLRNDEGRRRMGGAARIWCRSRFDIREVAPRYLRMYRDLVREPDRSRSIHPRGDS
jgi:glycosyltransferase involved in cell wall biosynthesis